MTGWRVGWIVAPAEMVRAIERLHQNLAISVPTLSQVAAEAAFDGRDEMEAIKHGYEENRQILLRGLPPIGFDEILPVDGAFYLYANVARFSDNSLAFAGEMLEKAGVAATSGVDFDPVRGHQLHAVFLRGFGGGNARGGRAHWRLAEGAVREMPDLAAKLGALPPPLRGRAGEGGGGEMYELATTPLSVSPPQGGRER